MFWGVFVAMSCAGLGAKADKITLRSAAQPVPLLELFTSEGCSSCPPAEQWLGKLRDHPGLWTEFVPIAWHVNYWDRLGWPDKFASADFTARQYAYARLWRARTVYTPGFVRGGEEWRVRDGEFLAPGQMAGGRLQVEIIGDELTAHFESPDDKKRKLHLHVARLGGGIESRVRAGENRGRNLHHEFVVLAWAESELVGDRATLLLPEHDFSADVDREAVAVWVSVDNSPVPLQAVGGWLSEDD